MGGFLHPLLALGVLTAAVPVIIHLLNRRRHKPMDWAAMRFARLAWKRIRRRSRFENLLLLLLRVAAVALFALALARPLTEKGGLLAGLSQDQRELYVLIDGSASMAYRTDLESLWDRALQGARERIESLDQGGGDRVHLYLVGDRPRRLSDRTPSDALSMLTSLEEPLAEGFDLGAALARVVADMDERNVRGEAEIFLFTDVQRANFLRPDGSLAPDAVEALDKLATRDAKVVIDDITPAFDRRPDNLSIARFVALDPFGDPLDLGNSSAPVLKDAQNAVFVAELVNSSDQAREVQVALLVDGERRPSKRVLVPALGREEVELELRLSPDAQAGHEYREVEAVIEADALPIDDRRALVVHAPGAIDVLLLNGSPATEPESDELTYLRAALAPVAPVNDGRAQAQSPFKVREASPADSQVASLVTGSDFIWLANVETPSAALVEALTERVRAGATLVISVGDRVAAATYSQALAELLPATLTERRGDASRRSGFRRARIDAPGHPALAFFRDETFELFFTEVPVFQFIASEPVADARVLASLDDAIGQGSPLLVERPVGQGKVYLWTTTIDTDWTLFPESPTSLIPLTHELAFDSARGRGPQRNLVIGEPITARFDAFPDGASLVEPGGAARRIDRAAVELPEQAQGTWELVARDNADHPGIWRVNTSGQSASFAVTMDANEGVLERLGTDELAGLSPVFVTGLKREANTSARDDGGELFRAFLWLALAMLIGEALWSRYLAREVRA